MSVTVTPMKYGKLPGYHLAESMLQRRKALLENCKIYDVKTKIKKLDIKKMILVKKRLTVLRNYTVRSQPANSRKYYADEKWLEKEILKLK